MMNIKGKGWNVAAGAGTDAAAETAGREASEELDDLTIADEDSAAEAPGEELSEAYADLLKRAMEQAPATVPTPAPVPAALAAQGISQASAMLRCGHIAAHGLVLAAMFWVAFGAASSWTVAGDSMGLSAQLANAFSYMTSYALAITLLGSPAVLVSASLPGRGAQGQRLACAGACVDGIVGLVLAGMAVAFSTPAPGLLAAVYLALAVLAVVSVLKA